MSRRPRLLLTDLPLHVVQRGNDRQACFFNERDYGFYLESLAESCARYGVLVHAYVLMTNHVHLLLTPLAVGAVSKVMQSVGARYVRFVNLASARSGTLWEGRYHACLVACDQHLLAACRYIDLNPVRGGLVSRASDYRWSSYLALSGRRHDPLVTLHAVLDQLGRPRGPAYAICSDCAKLRLANSPSDPTHSRRILKRQLRARCSPSRRGFRHGSARRAIDRIVVTIAFFAPSSAIKGRRREGHPGTSESEL
jgi:putative transposase